MHLRTGLTAALCAAVVLSSALPVAAQGASGKPRGDAKPQRGANKNPVASPKPASPPSALLRASARQLARDGQDLFRARKFAAALDRFERASQLVDVPTVHVRAARCLVKLNRLVEAAERYREVIRRGAPETAPLVIRAALADAKRELAELGPRIPWAVIQVQGDTADAHVELDGKPLPSALWGVRTAVDPGEHVVSGWRGEPLPGRGARQQTRFTIAEGQTNEVTFSLPALTKTARPAPAGVDGAPAGQVDAGPRSKASAAPFGAPSATIDSAADSGAGAQATLGWVLLGVGGASLLAGGIVGGLAVATRSDLEERCGSGLACPPNAHDDVDSYNAMRISTTVLLLAGAGLAATGVVTVLTTPNTRAGTPSEVALTLSPGALGLRLRY